MRWYFKQLQLAAHDSLQLDDGFSYKYLGRRPVFGDVLFTERPGQRMQLRARGKWVKLLFHTHAWCGSVRVMCNDLQSVEDLYAPEHGFRELTFSSGDKDYINLTIVSGAEPNSSARGNQVWIATVEFSDSQDWEIFSRPITDYCTLTKGIHGTFLTLSNDNIIGATIASTGIWAENDVNLFGELIEAGMTVLDIGANVGHHTVVYGKLVGPTGFVVSFEPQTAIYRLLAANVAMNGGANTSIVQCCVGSEEGEVYLYPVDYTSETNFGALGVDPEPLARSHKGEKCRVARLDDLLKELTRPVERIDFIKIDVQSFELFVLQGASDTIKRFKPTLFLEVAPFWMSKSYDYREIYRFLWDAGYIIDHLGDASVKDGEIKQWSGRETEEWDILARHRDGIHSHLDVQRIRLVFSSSLLS